MFSNDPALLETRLWSVRGQELGGFTSDLRHLQLRVLMVGGSDLILEV